MAGTTALQDKSSHGSQYEGGMGTATQGPGSQDASRSSSSGPVAPALNGLAESSAAGISASLAPTPERARPGQQVRLLATVRAIRDTRVESVSIELGNGPVLAAVQEARTLPAGQELQLRTNWTPGSSGTFTLVLVVDYLDPTGQRQQSRSLLRYQVG
jgi:hypothetical protein